MLEFRVSAGAALKARRRACGITQAELAARIGSTQPAISRAERGSTKVTLDFVIRALLELDAPDGVIAIAFDAANSPLILRMRERSQLPFFTRPRPRTRAGDQTDQLHSHRSAFPLQRARS